MIATTLVLLAEILFFRIEYRVLHNLAKDITLYIEYAHGSLLDEVIRCLRTSGAKIIDMEMTRSQWEEHHDCVIFSIQMTRSKVTFDEMMLNLSKIDNVISAQEL